MSFEFPYPLANTEVKQIPPKTKPVSNPFVHPLPLPPMQKSSKKLTRFSHVLAFPLFPFSTHLFLLLGLLLQHLLHDLLLLDEEGADDAVLHAVGAPRAAVRAADGLLGLRDLGVLAGSEGGELEGTESVVVLQVV